MLAQEMVTDALEDDVQGFSRLDETVVFDDIGMLSRRLTLYSSHAELSWGDFTCRFLSRSISI